MRFVQGLQIRPSRSASRLRDSVTLPPDSEGGRHRAGHYPSHACAHNGRSDARMAHTTEDCRGSRHAASAQRTPAIFLMPAHFPTNQPQDYQYCHGDNDPAPRDAFHQFGKPNPRFRRACGRSVSWHRFASGARAPANGLSHPANDCLRNLLAQEENGRIRPCPHGHAGTLTEER
jgi:hypothetical protein